MGMTFHNKEGTRQCRPGKPQQTEWEAISGDLGGPYLPPCKIRKLVFLSSTKHSPKANSFLVGFDLLPSKMSFCVGNKR